MELECWAELSAAIDQVRRRWPTRTRDTHPTALIVRVHLWSVLHDRPTSWACDRRHWNRPAAGAAAAAPAALPGQSTMSRRMRRGDFDPFLARLARRLNGRPAARLLKIVDGKALELPNHCSDPDARWGRGVSRTSLGYKLHLIRSGNPMPDAFVVTSLNVCEKQMAWRMVRRVGGGGYLLGDAHYDASWLFDVCHDHHHKLLCPRAKPDTGLGHRYQSPHRLTAIDQLEPPGGINDFGPSLYRRRADIERGLGNLCSFGGGLGPLPTWVRRIWRVRRWVHGKLLINAARIRSMNKRRLHA
jgi:hypothetical protein